MKFLEGIRFIF